MTTYPGRATEYFVVLYLANKRATISRLHLDHGKVRAAENFARESLRGAEQRPLLELEAAYLLTNCVQRDRRLQVALREALRNDTIMEGALKVVARTARTYEQLIREKSAPSASRAPPRSAPRADSDDDIDPWVTDMGEDKKKANHDEGASSGVPAIKGKLTEPWTSFNDYEI